MDPREVTVAASLRGSGLYGAAALVGKWHLGHRVDLGCLPGDGRRGFDDFFGLPYSHEEGYPGPFPEGVVWPPVPLYRNATIVEQVHTPPPSPPPKTAPAAHRPAQLLRTHAVLRECAGYASS